MALGQDTPVNELVLPYGLGWVQELPFHMESPPDTETQNVLETHEIADVEPQSPLVRLHTPRLYPQAFPSASTAAQ